MPTTYDDSTLATDRWDAAAASAADTYAPTDTHVDDADRRPSQSHGHLSDNLKAAQHEASHALSAEHGWFSHDTHGDKPRTSVPTDLNTHLTADLKAAPDQAADAVAAEHGWIGNIHMPHLHLPHFRDATKNTGGDDPLMNLDCN